MIVIVNFKNYPQVLGYRAVKVSRSLCDVAKVYGIDLFLAPPILETARVAEAVDCKVLSQKVDIKPTGATTGWIPVEAVKESDLAGSLVNHSEHRIPFWQIFKIIEKMKKFSLISVVCGATPHEVKILDSLRPTFIAYEPPELIGTDRSVSKFKREEISEIVEETKTPLLVGAGIKTSEDVKTALELGAEGILVASGVVKAENPAKALENLIL